MSDQLLQGRRVVVAAEDVRLSAELAERCRALGAEVSTVTAELEVLKVAQESRLDGLVYCATRPAITPGSQLSPTTFAETALGGVGRGLRYLQHAAEAMRGQGGALVVVTGIDGVLALPGRAAACTAFAALHMLVKVLAVEWAADGVRVNAIAPLWESPVELPPRVPAAFLDGTHTARQALGLPVTLSEIADLVAFLLGEEASYLTGEVLRADHGWSPSS